MDRRRIGIVGGGPAGLMAAEVLSARGHAVTVLEAMPTIGRKFLLAGKSGLNITHSEPYDRFAARFGAAGAHLRAALDAFTPGDLRTWAEELGTETFVGSSGRVFPVAMKASPLLRAWRARLEGRGVDIRVRHRWIGFAPEGLRFETPEGVAVMAFDAVLLALGGASWPRLGSDAAWVGGLAERGVDIAPFRPANCGFDVDWSPFFVECFAGAPVKGVTARSAAGTIPGEFVISKTGIEGSLVYAHAAVLRDALETSGAASFLLDLVPGRSHARLAADLARQGGKASFSSRLRKGAGLDGVKAAMLRECVRDVSALLPDALASVIKALPVLLIRPRPIAEAISVAGGIRFDALDADYGVKALPGVFAAGEMLDWEAPTGGYLLTACFATGRAAAEGIDRWLTGRAG
ncbi:NAD(FAD)-utilizing dehydrogenase [Shinella sp. SUS2]|uniref:TIGR03862 family flavoprotein n=1 Tax=unclassified Shinella TaxID=2643062 RepID=UPI00068112EE|nr:MULTISPECIES: TIGR03862 family flavoprotein [unclassified Shinella]KNY14944.1 NAD(FAD)-utilizing dehydrogenase [Shinella sp. SUS2]KOC74596.1 NAD(FAD)-utilizing dehydrogenase [Shinella sp. GWS1]